MDDLYLAPALARIPEQIRMARDYVDVAREFMHGPCYEYISGGSAAGLTAALNLRAFESLSVCPRVMRDIGSAHTRVDIPGASLAHPVLLAPVAHQVLAHPGAERETARGAAVTGTCMVASTLSTCTMEQIAAAGDATARWFQLYLQPDEAATAELVQRAERAGYSAIVITVDAALQVPGQGAMRLGFRMPPGAVPGNLRNPGESESTSCLNGEGHILRAAAASTPTWKQLLDVRESTSLPVWIKGVMHPEDALAVKQRGFSGIVVSNHGGRGLDGAPASIDALPPIRCAVGDGYPLLLDGGIRSGLDVFHSLARGADAVLVGRLQMYALAVAGALGVAHMLRLLREELEVCMALAGCTSIGSIRAQCGAMRSC
jgi:isopentenyl diphosphate isomerase/L-lactate dehydrogenase-like FMN-dependent dehydrogenase